MVEWAVEVVRTGIPQWPHGGTGCYQARYGPACDPYVTFVTKKYIGVTKIPYVTKCLKNFTGSNRNRPAVNERLPVGTAPTVQ